MKQSVLINGKMVEQELKPSRMPDEHLLNWFRGILTPPFINERDLSLSQDVRYLQPLLYFLARSHHAKTIVELGVADGSTTIPLLKAASEIEGGILHSVDPSGCEDAIDLVGRYKMYDVWKMYQMKSDDFFNKYALDMKIDFAFVDGDHSYAGVVSDIRNVVSRLVPGGIAIFHEWSLFNKDVDDFNNIPKDRSDLACSYGTCRAIYDVLNEFNVDTMPLHFGACGLKRQKEWTEGAAFMIRKRIDYEKALKT